jgi:hypothetical protein
MPQNSTFVCSCSLDGPESHDQCCSESFRGVAVRWGRVVLVFFGVLSACHVEPARRFMYV